MENVQSNAMELYNKGKKIIEEIERYSEIIANSEGEEKKEAEEKVQALNEEKEKLKEEIYKYSKEKTGLDYGKRDKNPEVLKEAYNEQLNDLNKRQQELNQEKARVTKLNEEKKAQIETQFNIAYEKYKTMLDTGKISQELFDSRIENMKSAKEKDALALDNSIVNVDNELATVSSEIEDVQQKIGELEQQEIMFNEYGDVYYRLFGEVLADRDSIDINIDKQTDDYSKTETEPENVENNKDSNEDKKENSEKDSNKEKKENSEKDKVINGNGVRNNYSNNGMAQGVANFNEEKEDIEEEEPKIVVTSKSMFDDLYKKMKKGNIKDNELSALAETLEDPDNYEKYGITTGLVFNKAKKILKLQGARTAKNIEKFIRENANFSDDIKFDPSIEKDGVLSHDILNSWKDIDEKLTYTDATFSVEKYIEQMEQYKEAGNTLTKEQEETLKKAMGIKNSIGSYRKAINTNEEVAMERNNKTQNSVFYAAFSKRAKSKLKTALPEKSKEESDPGYIVVEKPLDLSGMVNNEPSKEESETEKGSKFKENPDISR